MTKVAAVPTQLRAVAGSLHGCAADLETAAARLAGLSYPEMPAATEAVVRGLVGSAGSRLRRDAIVAETCSGDAKKRALWFEIADTLLSSPAVRGPKESFEALVNTLDQRERLRVGQLLREWKRWNRVVPDIVDDYGAESMQATRIWFIFQERSPLSHEQFLQMLEGAGETESYAAAVDVPLAGLRVVAGRVLAPLGIATNFMVMIHPEHDGWRGDVDRISGGLGVGSSAVLTAAAFGATIPGLDVVAGGVLLGVGAWQLGNLVWDNKKAIAHAVVGGAKFAYDHAGDLVGGPLGQIAWEHRGDAARAAVATATWGADHAESLATTAIGLASAGLGEGEHTAAKLGSGAVHGAEDAGKTVVGGISSGVSKVAGLF